MKLHLPLGLRRALYNTFIAILTGAAVAAPAWASTAIPASTVLNGTYSDDSGDNRLLLSGEYTASGDVHFNDPVSVANGNTTIKMNGQITFQNDIITHVGDQTSNYLHLSASVIDRDIVKFDTDYDTTSLYGYSAGLAGLYYVSLTCAIASEYFVLKDVTNDATNSVQLLTGRVYFNDGDGGMTDLTVNNGANLYLYKGASSTYTAPQINGKLSVSGQLDMQGDTLLVGSESAPATSFTLADGASLTSLGSGAAVKAYVSGDIRIGTGVTLSANDSTAGVGSWTLTGANVTINSDLSGTDISITGSLAGSATLTASDTITLSGGGQGVSVSADTLDVQSGSYELGKIEVTDLTKIASGASLTVNKEGAKLGTVKTGSANDNYNGTLTLNANATAASINKLSTLNVAKDITLTVESNADLYKLNLSGGAVMDVNGDSLSVSTVEKLSGTILTQGSLTLGGVQANLGTTYDITSTYADSINIAENGGDTANDTLSITAGTVYLKDSQFAELTVAEGAKASRTSTGLTVGTLTGTVEVVQGNVKLGTDGSNLTATISGGTMTLTRSNGGSITLADSSHTENELTVENGTLTLEDSTLKTLTVGDGNGPGDTSVSSSDAMTVGTLNIDTDGKLTAGGNVTSSAGTVEGTLDASGKDVTLGTVDGGTVTAANISVSTVKGGSLTASGTLTLSGTSDNASATINAASLSVQGNTTLTGSVNVTSGTAIGNKVSLSLASTATITSLGALTMGTESSLSGYKATSASINNGDLIYTDMEGALTLSTDANGTYTLTDASSNSSNSLSVNKGTVKLADGALNKLGVGYSDWQNPGNNTSARVSLTQGETKVDTVTVYKDSTLDAGGHLLTAKTIAMWQTATISNLKNTLFTSEGIEYAQGANTTLYTIKKLVGGDADHYFTLTDASAAENNDLTIKTGSQVTLVDDKLGRLTIESGVNVQSAAAADTMTVGELDVSGTLAMKSDNLTVSALNGTGSVNATGQTLTIEGNDDVANAITAATLTIGAQVTLSGTNAVTATTTTIEADDTLTIAAAAENKNLGTVSGANGTLNVDGTADAAGVTVEALEIDGSLTATGDVTVDTLVGRGTLDATGRTLEINADSTAATAITAGTLNVDADVTLTNTNAAAISAGATSIDTGKRLDVSATAGAELGAITLEGTGAALVGYAHEGISVNAGDLVYTDANGDLTLSRAANGYILADGTASAAANDLTITTNASGVLLQDASLGVLDIKDGVVTYDMSSALELDSLALADGSELDMAGQTLTVQNDAAGVFTLNGSLSGLDSETAITAAVQGDVTIGATASLAAAAGTPGAISLTSAAGDVVVNSSLVSGKAITLEASAEGKSITLGADLTGASLLLTASTITSNGNTLTSTEGGIELQGTLSGSNNVLDATTTIETDSITGNGNELTAGTKATIEEIDGNNNSVNAAEIVVTTLSGSGNELVATTSVELTGGAMTGGLVQGPSVTIKGDQTLTGGVLLAGSPAVAPDTEPTPGTLKLDDGSVLTLNNMLAATLGTVQGNGDLKLTGSTDATATSVTVGALEMAATASLTASGDVNASTNTATQTIAGTLTSTGANSTISLGASMISGDVAAEQGTIALNGASVTTDGSVTAKTLTVSGTTTISGAATTDTTTINDGGELVIDGSTQVSLGNIGMDAAGTGDLTLQNAAAYVKAGNVAVDTLTLAEGATLDYSGTLSFNQGTLSKVSIQGGVYDFYEGISYTNGSTLDVDTLTVKHKEGAEAAIVTDSTLSVSQTTKIEKDAVLKLNGTTSANFGSGISGEGTLTMADTAKATAASVDVTTLNMEGQSTLTASGTVTADGGSVAGTLNATGDASLGTSTVAATGRVDAMGSVTLDDVAGTVIAGTTATVGDVTGGVTAVERIIANSVDGGSLSATSTDSTKGDITIANGVNNGTISSAAGGIVVTTGDVKGSSNLSAVAGTINLEGATTTLTDGSLTAQNITLNVTTASSVTNGQVSATTGVNTGAGLTLSGNKAGTTHALGAVTGDALTLNEKAQATATTVTATTLSLADTTPADPADAAEGSKLTAESVEVASLNVAAESTLTTTMGNITSTTGGLVAGTVTAQAGDISLTGATLSSGQLTASKGNITLTNVDASASTGDISATQGTLSIKGDSTYTLAGSVQVGTLDLDQSANITTLLEADNTNIADGEVLTISGGDAHSLGVVAADGAQGTGGLALSGAATEASADSVAVGSLNITDATLTVDGDVETTVILPDADASSIAGTLTSTAGDITLADAAITGTVEATLGNVSLDATSSINGGTVTAGQTLSMAGGTATSGVLTAAEYTNSGDVTLEGGTLDFDKTTVGTGTTLTVTDANHAFTAGSDLGEVSVAGANTVLDMDVTGANALSGDITVTEQGTLELNGAHTGNITVQGTATAGETTSATLTDATLSGDIAVSDMGTLTLTNSTVKGSVTLAGLGDTLNLTDSHISHTLSVGDQSIVNITGTNTAGAIVLTEGSILNWDPQGLGNATLTLRDGLIIEGGSEATVGVEGIAGDISLRDGLLTLTDGAAVDGTISFDSEPAVTADSATRTMVVVGTVDLKDNPDGTEGSHSLSVNADGTVQLGDAVQAGHLTVDQFAGEADLTLTGDGSATFATASTSHTGDIVVEDLIGTVHATAQDSLGSAGAVVLTGTVANAADLAITADQQKDITVDKISATLTTAGQAVTLSGAVTTTDDAYELVLDAAQVTLNHADNAIANLVVNANSSATLSHAANGGGQYDHIANTGALVAHSTTIGNIDNMGAGTMALTNATVNGLIDNDSSAVSTIEDSCISSVDNDAGTLNITSTQLQAGAVIINGGTTAGTLTLSDSTNVESTVAGELINASGALAVTGGSDLLFGTLSLGGDTVALSGASTLRSTGDTTISAADADVTDSTLAAEGNMSITSADVDASGSTLAAAGQVTVAAGADVQLSNSTLASSSTTQEMVISGTVSLAPGAGSSAITTAEGGMVVNGSVTGDGSISSLGNVAVHGSIGSAATDFVGALSAADLYVSEAGAVELTGEVAVAGISTVEGSMNVNGNVSTDTLDVRGEASVSNGTLTATTADVSGALVVNQGTLHADELVTTGSTTVNGTVDTDALSAIQGGDVVINSTAGGNTLGSVLVDGAGSTVTLNGTDEAGQATGSFAAELVSVTNAAELTVKKATLEANLDVTDAALTLDDATVIGDVTFNGNNVFTIRNDNELYGTLTVSEGTHTSLEGTLTVHDSADATHPVENAVVVEGGSSYEIQSSATLNSDVQIKDGTLDVKGTLNAAELSFEGVAADSRVLDVNTDGAQVALGTVVVRENGTININGAEGAGTNLNLNTLVGAEGKELELNGKPGSTVSFTTANNNDFNADIDANIGTVILQATEALGDKGTLTMQAGSTLTTDAAAALATSKAIVAEGDLVVDTAKGLTLKDNLTAKAGTVTKAGEGTLTLSGATLEADRFAVDNGSTVVLDGEKLVNTNTVLSQATLVIQDNAASGAPTEMDAASSLTLAGATADQVLVQVDDAFTSGASVIVSGQGTMQTNAATTLTGDVSGSGVLVKTGDDSLTLAHSNADLAGKLDHQAGTLAGTADNAFGSAAATVLLNGGKTVELGAASFANNWDAQKDVALVAQQASTLSGAITGNGSTITKTGEAVTLVGKDADSTTKGSYTMLLTRAGGNDVSPEGRNILVLDDTQRRGTFAAEAGTGILVKGQSTVGDLALTGDGQAAHKTLSENATHVVINEVGTDTLSAASGKGIKADQAQLVVNGWSQDPHSYTDGQRLKVAGGITDFDKEIVHDLVLRNVNLVEKDGNSYVEVSINHKAAHKNPTQASTSAAITASEGSDGRLGELVEAMAHTSSEAISLAALDSVAGRGIATTMSAQMGASRDHMRTLRHSIGQPVPHAAWGDVKGCPQEITPTHMWMSLTGASSNLGNDGQGGAGYTRHDAGFLVGGDVTLGKRALVGLAAGYSRSHLESCAITNTGDHYFVDAYGRYNHGQWTHSATLGAGVYDWNLERYVHVQTSELYANFDGQGRGRTKGTGINFSYEVAYTWQVAERHTLAPVFQLESSYNHIDGYRENGSLRDAGLDVSFDDAFVATFGLGARYSYSFDGYGDSWQKGHVSAQAMAIYEAGDANACMHGSFIGSGATFNADSTKQSRAGLLLGVDTLIPMSRHWSAFGSASLEVRDNFRDLSAGAGVRYTF